jgi:hypothetical protein
MIVSAAGGAFADTWNPIHESQTQGYDHIPAFSKSRNPLSFPQVIETVRLLRRSKVATPMSIRPLPLFARRPKPQPGLMLPTARLSRAVRELPGLDRHIWCCAPSTVQDARRPEAGRVSGRCTGCPPEQNYVQGQQYSGPMRRSDLRAC